MEGREETIASSWTDYVLLSARPDSGPHRIRRFAALRLTRERWMRRRELQRNALNVDVPQGLSGQYYVFIRLDFHNKRGRGGTGPQRRRSERPLCWSFRRRLI
jgi:hypothetical protein